MNAFSPNRFKVLCVEDEPEILRDIAEELADYGFVIEKAESAEAALLKIEAELPDLVVCDVQMPGMNGIELLETLRARQDERSLVPFVFLTAFNDRTTMISGRRAGADDYLVKPVDYDLLIATVESHLQNARQRHTAAQAAGSAEGGAGRSALVLRLAKARPREAVAVVKIDSQPELARRFEGRGQGRIQSLIDRLARRTGMEVYNINAFAWGVIGPSLDDLEQALQPLVDLSVRDAQTVSWVRARLSLSAVTAEIDGQTSGDALLERLMDSAHLLRREGGGQLLRLDGAAMAELRLASSIRNELVTALQQGQLHVCFQPKVCAESGQPVSAEVLVRWESPQLGQLSPTTFIPVVERAGMLSHLTDWVLRETAVAQKALIKAGLPPRLAVNIGATEFKPDLPGRISRIFAEFGADERLLEVEVTETSVLSDTSQADSIVQALHARGIAVALDDFGTGYSSLAHLQACTVDTIKIDRSFVKRVAESGPDQKIVLGIIGLAKMLGLETVAEGVELESQRRWLTANDCNTLQGYVISKPLRFENYCDLLRRWPPADAPDAA